MAWIDDKLASLASREEMRAYSLEIHEKMRNSKPNVIHFGNFTQKISQEKLSLWAENQDNIASRYGKPSFGE